MTRLFQIIDLVGGKTLSQTDNYADEKVGDKAQDVIAAPGRRLRRGVSWFAIVIIVFFITLEFGGALLQLTVDIVNGPH